MENIIELETHTISDNDINNKKGKIVVWNDDFNTFEHVANTVSRYCNVPYKKAMEYSHIIHNNGKCMVYQSKDYNELEYIKIMLELNLLTVTID